MIPSIILFIKRDCLRFVRQSLLRMLITKTAVAESNIQSIGNRTDSCSHSDSRYDCEDPSVFIDVIPADCYRKIDKDWLPEADRH